LVGAAPPGSPVGAQPLGWLTSGRSRLRDARQLQHKVVGTGSARLRPLAFILGGLASGWLKLRRPFVLSPASWHLVGEGSVSPVSRLADAESAEAQRAHWFAQTLVGLG